uniref:BED-type domain-containing protein n=1 Tax=Romanomermis culicivorax TaxID=13658 RepID=A0A915ITZ8_ROMCU
MDEDHSDSMTSFSAISTLLTESSPVGHNNGAKTEDFWSLDHGRKTKPLLNPIHAYFQYNEETGCSHCRLCPEKMKGRWTSNLKRHISSKHAGHYIDFLNHMADLSGNGNCSAPIPNLATSSMQQKNMLMNHQQQPQSATATVIVPPLMKNMTVKNRPNVTSLHGLGQGAGGSKNRDLMASSFAGEDGSSNQDEDEESESDSFHLFEKTNLKIKPRRSVGQANETPNYFLAAAENRRRINDDKLNCIAQAFIYNNLPCRLMDETNFKRMFTVVSNGAMLAPPSGRQVEDQIRWLSDHLKSKIADKIQKTRHLSISSRFFLGEKFEGENSNRAFLFVACHFFDKESNCLKNYLLSCKSIYWDINPNLNSLINETLDEWSIDQKKIFRVMTGNKSEVSNMIRQSIACGRSLKTNAFVNDMMINQNKNVEASNYKKTKFEIDEISLENVDVENFEREESKMNDLLDTKRLSYFFDELVVAIQKLQEIDIFQVLDNSSFKNVQIQIRNFLDAFHLISPLKETSAVMIGNRYLPKLSSSLWIQWYYLLEALIEIKDEIKEICRKYPTSFNLYPQDFLCMEESVIVLKPIISTINNSGRLENDLSIAALYPILFGLVTKLRRAIMSHKAENLLSLFWAQNSNCALNPNSNNVPKSRASTKIPVNRPTTTSSP